MIVTHPATTRKSSSLFLLFLWRRRMEHDVLGFVKNTIPLRNFQKEQSAENGIGIPKFRAQKLGDEVALARAFPSAT
jgi:hypothetical protein